MSNTVLKFKRGNTEKVAAYTGASQGEPVYDFDSRKLYIGVNDVGTLTPINNTHNIGYHFTCSTSESVFYISYREPNHTKVVVHINQILLAESEYSIDFISSYYSTANAMITLNTPTQANDVIDIDIIEKPEEQQEIFISNLNQTVFTLTKPLIGIVFDICVNGRLLPESDYSISGSTITLNSAPDQGSEVKITNYIFRKWNDTYGLKIDKNSIDNDVIIPEGYNALSVSSILDINADVTINKNATWEVI